MAPDRSTLRRSFLNVAVTELPPVDSTPQSSQSENAEARRGEPPWASLDWAAADRRQACGPTERLPEAEEDTAKRILLSPARGLSSIAGTRRLPRIRLRRALGQQQARWPRQGVALPLISMAFPLPALGA